MKQHDNFVKNMMKSSESEETNMKELNLTIQDALPLTMKRKGMANSNSIETNPKRKDTLLGIFLLFGIISALWSPLVGASPPVVSNVTASQRTDGSKLVDVYYDLSGGVATMEVSVAFSHDNGQTWGNRPSSGYISGDVGQGITNGTGKHIVWDAGQNRPNAFWAQAGVKIRATEEIIGEELTVMLPGDVPLVLVRIPAGSFEMGSPVIERSREEHEGPVHTVTIAEDFYMGKYEVTQLQWIALVGAWPRYPPHPNYGEGDNYPAYYLSWDHIAAAGGFVEKLNEYIAGTGQGPATFRLPSEAEWEYCCRAGTQTRFFFGDAITGDDDADDGPAGTLPGNRSDYMWYQGNNSPRGSKEVGTNLPNQFGLYDMHGNVYEWCEDYYHSDYTNAPTDGTSWDTPSGSERVLRGGNWGSFAKDCRSATRYPDSPNGVTYYRGFRLLRTRN